ncbi:polysaccharide deacetylase family protein [Burkholderia cepacia]|uniref:Polysaccharide deacetylase n=1 Tax=Burkholderia cepacia TaxID=292 RepID=A0A104AEE0_BURCE|nr:polysaccharide deacetylase family protein [Burkholderia cepacia]KVK86269.1 polysaccharide deacetylase [Burkholderia cepacia]KVK96780.1 polysaccharide deacetylase [Burkholderia cepacia]
MPICLSFDDGPGPSTPLLLDVLRAASCRATFFLLGRNLAGALDVAARMAREGHLLGNHTLSHAKPGTLSDDALIDEIETTDALIREACRAARVPAPDPIPLRLPYGLMPHDGRARVLARLQREHTGWTAILDDWQRPAPSPQALFDAMCAHVDASAARQRDVLFCMHDGSRHGEARPNTVEAVRLFLNRQR